MIDGNFGLVYLLVLLGMIGILVGVPKLRVLAAVVVSAMVVLPVLFFVALIFTLRLSGPVSF